MRTWVGPLPLTLRDALAAGVPVDTKTVIREVT